MAELKKVLNHPEALTHAKLKSVCEKYGATIFPKIRLADVFPIENSVIEQSLYKYALMAHFDFLVANGENHTPLFAVEFDGPYHQDNIQIKRDEKKNELCKSFQLPLLRINSNHISKEYRNLDLLSWLVEVWFSREAFFEWQEKGYVPYDEIFSPMLIGSLPDRKETFPLWLSASAILKIRKLWEAQRIKSWSPSGEWIGVDAKGNYHGFIWIWLDDTYGTYYISAIRSQNFPVVESDLLSEILICELYEKLIKVIEGSIKAETKESIVEKFGAFEKRYKERRSMLSREP